MLASTSAKLRPSYLRTQASSETAPTTTKTRAPKLNRVHALRRSTASGLSTTHARQGCLSTAVGAATAAASSASTFSGSTGRSVKARQE